MKSIIYTDLVLRMIANFPGLVCEEFDGVDRLELVKWLQKEMIEIEKLDPTISHICEVLKRSA